ncbi:hypothetical protein [Micromonospora sp. DT233]|uniref:hypothetical protein n=1 Tax=Micromonospora sp. DT233 TaxID=3393432 RepID=UPI003CEAD22F
MHSVIFEKPTGRVPVGFSLPGGARTARPVGSVAGSLRRPVGAAPGFGGSPDAGRPSKGQSPRNR